MVDFFSSISSSSRLGDTGSVVDLAKQLYSAIEPQIATVGVQITKQIGTQYYNDLYDFGVKSVNDVTKAASNQVPFPVNLLLVTYSEHQEQQRKKIAAPKRDAVPSVVMTLIDPITKPIIEGAKAEASRRLNITVPKVAVVISLLLLTIFSTGYIVGVVRSKGKSK